MMLMSELLIIKVVDIDFIKTYFTEHTHPDPTVLGHNLDSHNLDSRNLDPHNLDSHNLDLPQPRPDIA